MKRINGQIYSCKKCGKSYKKTSKTGHQCDACRRGRGSKGRSKKIIFQELDFMTTQNLFKFMQKVERSRFYLDTWEVFELIHFWEIIAPVRIDRYDKFPVGDQCCLMWKDLNNWKEAVLENNI